MEKENSRIINDVFAINEEATEKCLNTINIYKKKIHHLSKHLNPLKTTKNMVKITKYSRIIQKNESKLDDTKLKKYFKYVAKEIINHDTYEYVKKIAPELSKKIKMPQQIQLNVCPECKSENFIFDSELGCNICQDCGNVLSGIGDMKIISRCYDKKCHLINSFASQKIKRNKQLPQKDYTKIMKKLRSMNTSQIRPQDVRKVLKNMGYNKYYPYVSKLYSDVTGNAQPQMTEDESHNIITMFKEVEDIWEHEVKPDNRKNFLSYKFIIRQILEYFGMKQHLKYYYYSDDQDKLQLLQFYWGKIIKIYERNKAKHKLEIEELIKKNKEIDDNKPVKKICNQISDKKIILNIGNAKLSDIKQPFILNIQHINTSLNDNTKSKTILDTKSNSLLDTNLLLDTNISLLNYYDHKYQENIPDVNIKNNLIKETSIHDHGLIRHEKTNIKSIRDIIESATNDIKKNIMNVN